MVSQKFHITVYEIISETSLNGAEPRDVGHAVFSVCVGARVRVCARVHVWVWMKKMQRVLFIIYLKN